MKDGSNDFVLCDARIVLADRVIDRGWLAIANGRIAQIEDSRPPAGGRSMGGDLLIPGLVELHTDHLEAHVQPRPGVRWNTKAAVLAYDAQIVASGITTVYDCIRIGTDGAPVQAMAASQTADPELLAAFETANALAACLREGSLRSDHHAHLRCEVCSNDVVVGTEKFLAHFPVGLISLMDHTPGQRQFRDAEKLKNYYRGKLGYSEEQLARFFRHRLELHERNAVAHRRKLVDIARRHALPLASHDDTTVQHVDESLADGARLAEFPTTIDAAKASHEAGISVMMGAPNVIRGGSHSGNVAAEDLARLGLLDILSSDYIPASLLLAALELPQRLPAISLPAAVALVTRNPARAVGLTDRGELKPDLRADLVRVKLADVPLVREVYREGVRVV
jgi:alpha-D-ribose 1-methylphosphonate 5-triphosphate diphosphatase